MEPLENTVKLLHDIVEASNPVSESGFTINIDPDSHDLYRRDLEILVWIKKLIMDGTKCSKENIDKLMKGELSIICPKDKETIHDAMGLCKDILLAVNKWL